MKKKYVFTMVIIGLFLVGFAGISYFPTNVDTVDILFDEQPTRRQLRRNFYEKGELLVVYASADSLCATAYRDLLHKVPLQESTRSWRNVRVRYKDAASVTEEELGQNVIFLVGAFQEHPILKRFLRKTPFAVKNKGISVGKRSISSNNTVLTVSFYPNPLNPSLPFGFITGADETNVLRFLKDKVEQSGRSFYRQNLDYELYQKDKRLVLGDFDAHWKIDSTTFFDFSKRSQVLFETEQFRFISHQKKLQPKAVNNLHDSLVVELKKVLNFVQSDNNIPQINIHSYDSMEDKGLMTGNTDQAHIDTLDASVHTIRNKIYKGNHIGKENALVLHYLLGTSNKDIFTYGLPVYFTHSWQKRGYSYWGARLVESQNSLSLAALMNNEDLGYESSLIRDCMGALLVEFFVKTWGKKAFLDRYKNFEIDKAQQQTLETAWQSFLESLPKRHPRKLQRVNKLPYVKGFNFAHEGYSIYNGYGSTKATVSLRKQHDMGANAIAVVPYSGIRNTNAPAPFGFSKGPGSENDEAVVHTATKASELGMFTLLKPQIFVGGSWPGGIEMQSNADWDLFFDHYYRWIRHYAFLAEIYDMDALSLGVEFTKASLQHPEAWRAMINKTRGLFSGQLTYAANWGEEFENIEFWNELDFIGLNCYYPLSKEDSPTDAALTEKFETIKTKIRTVHNRFKKPIVFTEIGFRSVDTPWKNPHAEADESINEQMQQRCYEIIFKGIENEPWCQGILWWKFPSFLEYRGEENNAFTPNNKLAEQTVRKWFSK